MFWSLTPRELAILVDGWVCREKRRVAFENRLTARICATVANARALEGWNEDDFMPDTEEQTDTAPGAESDREWQAALAALAPYGVKERTNGRR